MNKYNFRDDILPLKNMLYRLALRITLSETEAEDVVQDTLIKVWNRRASWDDINSMEAFCSAICRNIALDRIRKSAGDQQSLDHIAHETADPSTGSNPEAKAIVSDKVALIRRLFNQLPEKQRTVMQLREIEGMSYKEIAEAMAISEEQVKVNLFRARQTIRKKYTEAEDYGL